MNIAALKNGREAAMSNQLEWVVITGGEGQRVDIVDETQALLTGLEYAVERRGPDLYLPEFGLTLSPRGLNLPNSNGGSVSTVSIVRATHPKIFPTGVFEYQHGAGADAPEALRYGLNQWAQLDLPVLCDALLDAPKVCATMEMTFPTDDGGAERRRRILLGQTAHAMASPPETATADSCCEEHSFCPCCLTTQCMDAFMPLLKSDQTLGVRMFAMRDAEGATSADCRINGEDFEAGKEALRAYADKWPGHGFEFRKQYVLFQSLPIPAP